MRYRNLGTLAIALLAFSAATHAQDASEVFAKVRSTYGALASYSDSGTVIREYGRDSTERDTFVTAFRRAPRAFLFDFRAAGSDRYVVWGDPDAFHTWRKATANLTDYPNPNNAPAIAMSGQATSGAILLIPTLLYSKAPLGGTFNNFAALTLEGTETVGGRACWRIGGSASESYGTTGKVVNERRLTVWVDKETYLVRQAREEWKPLPGQRSRHTYVYDPRANPKLEDAAFRFAPPGAR